MLRWLLCYVQVKNWELVLKITFMKSMNLHFLKHGTGFLLMTFDSPEAATAASDCFFYIYTFWSVGRRKSNAPPPYQIL